MAHSIGARVSSAAHANGSWIALAVACGITVFLLAPRTAPFFAVLASLSLALLAGRLDRRALSSALTGPMLAMLALAAWGLVTVAWAADRTAAVGKVALLLLFAAGVSSVVATRAHIAEARLRSLMAACLTAFLLGLGFLCIEELSGHAVKRFLYEYVPFVRPPPKHVGMTYPKAGEEVLLLAAHLTNRSMAALTLALWPMLLVAWLLGEPSRRWIACAAIMAAAVATIFGSQHATSALALVAATLCVALAVWKPRIAFALVAAGWLVASLLIVPMTDLGFRVMRLHEAAWVPHSGRQRVILWGYTAEKVKERPILGVGTDSTKPLDARRGPQVETPAGYAYQLRTGPHAHNIYLQAWYELGAPGALLLCGFGLLLLSSVWRLPEPARPFMLAAFVSAAAMAGFSWGMWQAWFMGAFAVSAILAVLAVELQHRAWR